ncbi:hypothetical protein AZH53_06410 [Methanomicrobiaceae archaeon CYW5]|uniref:PEGA domain-containing protein n=1 Tax=Methanovulcanius yangii TaxID=1789227 RepID=UPI0029CA589D|nr:PEGA domain-containing protein [Methanovulcanius yangii]MBT8508038.1 hypothetical protein [Methanovulcanius yangii]
MDIHRIVPALVALLCLCGAVQGVSLRVTVTDDVSGDPVSDANIYVEGTYEGETNSEGVYIYEHSLNESFRMGIEKTGYISWQSMVSATQSTLAAELSRKAVTLTVSLYDADTLEPVDGVLVKVSGEDYLSTDTTDGSGDAVFEVKAGMQYSVEVSASHFELLNKIVEMGNEARFVDYRLIRDDIFVVEVTDAKDGSSLSQADVYIDEKFVGATGSDGRVTAYVERGRTYPISVAKDEYSTFTDQLYIESDLLIYPVVLSKALYPVAISVYEADRTPIEGAKIYIDEDFHGTTDEFGHSGIARLIAGVHEVEVRADAYETVVREVTVDESVEDIIIQPEFAMASVTILAEEDDHTPVEGATVRVDGTYVGTTDATGQFETVLRTNAAYVISVSGDAYNEASVEESIPKGTSVYQIEVTMEKSINIGLIIVVGGIVVIGVAGIMGVRHLRNRPGKRNPQKKNQL